MVAQGDGLLRKEHTHADPGTRRGLTHWVGRAGIFGLSLGVFIAQQPSAEEFVDALKGANVHFVRLGTQRLEPNPDQRNLDLRRMLEPAGNGRLFDPHLLTESGITTAVNAGDLCSLANTIRQNYGGNVDRETREDPGLEVLNPDRPLWDLPVKQSASQVLRSGLGRGGVEIQWLADVSRRNGLEDFYLEKGWVTDAQLDWTDAELHAAIGHARKEMSKRRFAAVWIGGPTGGRLRFDIDEALERPNHPINGRAPLAIWLAPNPSHCALDPPYVTEQHVEWAGENRQFSGFVIDAGRGVLTTRFQTAEMADAEFGLPILAV